MDWRNIPSLSALRAFEATARLNGFSAAARELNVTHAAIAQHVRGLEDYFGQTLAFRQGRRMELTTNGQRLASALSDGFLTIQAGVSDLLAESKGRPLNISTTPAFAENWLMPRLGSFWQQHPDIKLAILPNPGLVDLRRDGIDLAIRYGKGHWPGYQIDLLTSARFVVVATPDYIDGRAVNALGDLSGLKWLLESDRREPQLWAQAQGLDMDRQDVSEFATGTLLQIAARAGYGLAILPQAVVEHDIANGVLVNLFTAQTDTLGYFLVTQKDRHSNPLNIFIKWLKNNT